MSLGLFAAAVAVRLGALMVLGLHPSGSSTSEQALSLLASEGYQRIQLGTPHFAQVPPLYAVHKLHPLLFDALFLALTVLAVLRLAPVAAVGAYGRAGIVLGVATLTRPTLRRFALPAALWLSWIVPPNRRRLAVAGVAVFLGAATLVVLPGPFATMWSCTDSSSSRRTLPSSSGAGNNPIPTGSALLLSGRPVFAGAPEAFRREILTRDELGQADLFREASRADMHERPAAFATGVVRKFASFWWFPSTAGLTYPGAWLVVYRFVLWRAPGGRRARRRLCVGSAPIEWGASG
jgi:hypothetical protein